MASPRLARGLDGQHLARPLPSVMPAGHAIRSPPEATFFCRCRRACRRSFAFKPGDEQDPRDEQGRVIYDSGVTLPETWRALERLVDEGHCRSIGLSDITLEKLQEILSAARIKPSVVQVESHPYLPEWELLDFCREHGIVLQAFAAVGHTLEPNVLADPVVTTIAERVHKTPTQVVLARSVQRGTAFLTTSTKPQRIRENFDISALPEDAMREIRDRITTSVRFNSVVETGVPDLFPGPNGSNSAARSRKGESGNLRVPFAGEQG